MIVTGSSNSVANLNTVANYDPEIIFLLNAPIDKAFQEHYPSGSLGLSPLLRYLVLTIAVLCNLSGAIWSFRSLPVSQRGRGLCTQGAYRWVRHPLYASFITLGAPGFAVFFNRWSGLLWLVALHVLWHVVIAFEEKNMAVHFGDDYLAYARRTGRFVPRLFQSRTRA